MCDHCHEWPTDADETRMTLDIYGQWLRTGVLDADGYRHVAHAAITKYPHLRREAAGGAGRHALLPCPDSAVPR